MFYRVSSVVIVILFLSVVARGSSQTDAKKAKHYALYAPRPQYPLEARKHHWPDRVLSCAIFALMER